MFEFLKTSFLFALFCLSAVLSACGGGDAGEAPASPTSVGLWTDQRGLFVLITPDGETWAVNSVTSPPGLMLGQATETAGGNITAQGLMRTGTAVSPATLTGRASAGFQLSGTLTEGSQVAEGIELDYLKDFDTHANVARYAGYFQDQDGGGFTLLHDGSFSGLSGGCEFSGKLTPDASGKNFFRVAWRYGPGPCALPSQLATGVAVPWGLTQLLMGLSVTPGTPEFAVLLAKR